jgi:LuxR family maltose regulon positive regulatory protein
MVIGRQAISIIRTKLHRPPVAADIVCRPALHARLDAGRRVPLSLTAAPAGYGKSTVVSHWLETCGYPSAWLSLDETDSDLRVFVSYLVAAVQTVYPTACQDTLLQLQADELPSTKRLGGLLCNDLDAIGKEFILALDDYQRIRDSDVHELMDFLLEHPPRGLHLTIMSRRDPPLSLGSLRAGHRMIEIRMQDLEFTADETAAFLERAIGHSLGSSSLKDLQNKTEGWPVALRLAALALQHQNNAEEFLQGFGGDSRQLQEYLVAEILAHQSPDTCDCLCRTAILDRFCAPLCQSLCDTKCGPGECTLRDRTADQAFLGAGLLCIPLDDRQEWYRYHHLFQELLQRYLQEHLDATETASLHDRASRWFEEQGLLDEAIQHALKGSDPRSAGSLIARHRSEILNEEQWHRLDQWLRWLPPGTAEDNPELLLLKAWLLANRCRHAEAHEILDRIDELLVDCPPDVLTTQRIQGGVDSLRSFQRYAEGEGNLAVAHAEQALVQLPPEFLSERGYAIILLSAAHQMVGHLDQARQVVYDALADDAMPSRSAYHTRLLYSLCFVEWMAADLPALKRTATQGLEMSGEFGLLESSTVGRYFVGIVHYQQNKLSAAKASLVPVVTNPVVANSEYFAQCAFALASVYQACGQADEAAETAEFIVDYLLKVRNMEQLPLAQAFQAELALRQGRLAEALRWAQHYDPEPFVPLYRFYAPPLTLAKVLIAEGSQQSREQAADLLTRLETYLAKIHNTRFLIEVLALQTLLQETQGETPAALERLGRAVTLAQPGGCMRLFVDLGPRIAMLLERLELDQDGRRYIRKLMAAFRDDEHDRVGNSVEFAVVEEVATGPQPQLNPLTKREVEILGMLAKRLTNKEIAGQLHISPATVKRHAESIYDKLGVRGRRQAVAKARELGILRES